MLRLWPTHRRSSTAEAGDRLPRRRTLTWTAMATATAACACAGPITLRWSYALGACRGTERRAARPSGIHVTRNATRTRTRTRRTRSRVRVCRVCREVDACECCTLAAGERCRRRPSSSVHGNPTVSRVEHDQPNGSAVAVPRMERVPPCAAKSWMLGWGCVLAANAVLSSDCGVRSPLRCVPRGHAWTAVQARRVARGARRVRL